MIVIAFLGKRLSDTGGDVGRECVRGRFSEAVGEVDSAAVSGRFAEAIGEVGSAVVSGRFSEGRLGVDSACVNRRSAACTLEQNGSAHCRETPRLVMMMLVGALGFLSKVGRKFLCWLWVSLWSLLLVRVRKKRRFARVTLVGRVPRRTFAALWLRVGRKPQKRGVVLCVLLKIGPMMRKVTVERPYEFYVALRGSLVNLGKRRKAWVTTEAPIERVFMMEGGEAQRGLPQNVTIDSEEEELIPDQRPSDKRKRRDPSPPADPPAESSAIPDVPEEPVVPVSLTAERLRRHRDCGHQPYLSFCDTCQSARGRLPARRKNMKSHYGPGELQVDFGFFGRHCRFLLIVHVLSGYLSTVVLGPEDPVPVPAICKALSEMGLSGLDIVVHGDQENLLESVFRDSAKHRTFVGRSLHWVPFAVSRPQAKGVVERNICILKEAFWSVWLGLEERVGEQLPLGSHLFVEAMRYSVRMHNLFHVSKEQQSTPLERLRGSTVQPVKSCEFGVVGFGKPQKDYPEHRGKRLVRAIYVGPHGANGSGVRVFVPFVDGKAPRLEVFSSFRPRDPVEFDKEALKLLLGTREDPERPISFDVPKDLPAPPPDPPAVPELPEGSLEFPVERAPIPDDDDPFADVEGSEYEPSMPDDEMGGEGPEGVEDEDAPMEAGEEDTTMEDGLTWLNEYGLRQIFEGPDLRVVQKLKKGDDPKEWFKMKFGGRKIWVHVPDNAVCEVSGKVLPRKHLEEGMKLELSELDAFGVATIIGEAEARKKATRRIHTTRWVLTSKPSVSNPERVRARLVVRDYAFGSNPLADGIYSPTTSLEALRGVLAIHGVRGGTLLSADVSVAFMQAPVQGVECRVYSIPQWDV